MGAVDFFDFGKGADMNAAYNRLVEQARHESGHGGYTGTIAESYGACKVLYQPVTLDAAKFFAGQNIERCWKGEAANAIPVAADSQFTLTKVVHEFNPGPVRKFKPEYEGDTGSEQPMTQWDLQELAEQAMFKKYGEQIHAIKVEPKIKTKTVVEPAKGKPVIRYQVDGYRTSLHRTKAQAVAAARKLLQGSTQAVSVRQVKYWPESDTTSAFVVRSVTEAATAKITVTLAKPKNYSPPVVGWLFYGLASM